MIGMFLLILITVFLIFAVDGVPLIRKKQWAELTVLVAVLAVSCSLFIGKEAGVPAPLKLLSELLKGLGKELFG